MKWNVNAVTMFVTLLSRNQQLQKIYAGRSIKVFVVSACGFHSNSDRHTSDNNKLKPVVYVLLWQTLFSTSGAFTDNLNTSLFVRVSLSTMDLST